MTLLAFASAKGSPGVTTAALAIGGVWRPERRVMMVEADPAGGDVAARFGLPGEPGLVSMAAAARHGLSVDLVVGHAQLLPDGLPVVAGPSSGEQAHSAVERVVAGLAEVASGRQEWDVMADCGRLDPGSPAWRLMEAAGLAVILTRGSLAQLRHLSALLPLIKRRSRQCGVVLVGSVLWPADEVAASLGIRVFGELAWDPEGASLLEGDPGTARALRRSPLVRSARPLAETLASASEPRRSAEMETSATAASDERGGRAG